MGEQGIWGLSQNCGPPGPLILIPTRREEALGVFSRA
jgi:hypothetical protein